MISTKVEDFKLEDWLPVWINANDAIAVLAALAVLVAFMAIWQALRGPDPFTRRVSQVAQRRVSLRHQALERHTRQRVTAAGLMSEVVTRLNLLRSKHAQDARMLLAQAGMRMLSSAVREPIKRRSSGM